MDNILQIALNYSQLGFSVLPLDPGSKRLAEGFGRGQQRIKTPDDLLIAYLTAHPDSNIGLEMGQLSGNIVALDFDNPTAYDRWAAAHPEATKTATSKTHRGYHVLLRLPELPAFNFHATNGAQVLVGSFTATYIAVWPSIHPKGTQYRWLTTPWENIAEVASLEAVEIIEKREFFDYDETYDETYCLDCGLPIHKCDC